jgi:hypothetical protein
MGSKAAGSVCKSLPGFLILIGEEAFFSHKLLVWSRQPWHLKAGIRENGNTTVKVTADKGHYLPAF